MAESLKELIETIAKPGHLEWIGLRPERRGAIVAVEQATLTEDGLEGDHGRPGKRALTLIQQEHLAVIGSFLGVPSVDPLLLRRNLVVSGINLVALKGRAVRIGEATVLITGPCAPCSRMEEAFGRGGYSAVRGHGGMTASVITPGVVNLKDAISAIAQ